MLSRFKIYENTNNKLKANNSICPALYCAINWYAIYKAAIGSPKSPMCVTRLPISRLDGSPVE